MYVTMLPLLPGWLIVLIVLGLVVLLVHGSGVLTKKKVPQKWVGYLATLRVVAIVIFTICLLRPVVSYTAVRQGGPDLIVLVDHSASMAGEGNRTRVAELTGRMDTSGLTAALDDKFNVHWFSFDHNARQIAGIDEARALPTDGTATRIAESLTTAWTYQQQLSRGVDDTSLSAAKVVILTDANDQSTVDPVEVAQTLGLNLFPIPAPSVADIAGNPSVRIESINSPQRVLLGSEARFQVTLRSQSAAGVPLNVELLQNGEPVTQRNFTFGEDELERTLTLTHRPNMAGSQRYAVRVSAAEANDALEPVQPYEMTVEVRSRSNKVLILEDTWRWQFRYLRRLLEEDPSFTFAAFMSRGPGIFMQFAAPDNPVNLAGFPRGRSELEWFDVFVLGDVSVQNWPTGMAASLREMVVEEGKSLVVIAGPNIHRFATEPALAGLLPVEIEPRTARPVPGPVALELTPEGRASSFFFTPQQEGLVDRWVDLPEMDQIYVPLRKRPAATILMHVPDYTNEFGSAIVMAEHTVGKGRVLYIGTDSLWKWQTMGVADDDENTPHSIFWQQTFRALAPTRTPEGEVNVWVRTDRTRYSAGERARIRVDLDARMPGERPEVRAMIGLPDGRDLPAVLVRDSASDTVFRAEFEATEPGQYTVTATAVLTGRTLADRRTSIDVDDAALEDARVETNLTAIRRLANNTGGNVVDFNDPTTWPTHNQPDQTDVIEARTFDPWGSFYLLLALVFVLGTDWLLRLLRGFV